MMYPTKCAHIARVQILLGAGAAAILAALWLRYSHTDARYAVTQVLSADGRAVLEHVLSAVGLPLFLHMMLIVAVPPPADSAFGYSVRYPVMSAEMPWRSAGPVQAAVNIVLRNRWCQWSWTTLLRVSSMLYRYCGTIISIAYFACALMWEHYQSYVSVYGGPPRGYVQYEQLLADAVGAVLAVLVARWFAANDEWAFQGRQD